MGIQPDAVAWIHESSYPTASTGCNRLELVRRRSRVRTRGEAPGAGVLLPEQEQEFDSRSLDPLGGRRVGVSHVPSGGAQGAIPTVATWQRNSMCK